MHPGAAPRFRRRGACGAPEPSAGTRVGGAGHPPLVAQLGQAYRQTYCFVFRVADGRITEVVEHCDTALVERVLTPLR
jgi:uncharacterized protein